MAAVGLVAKLSHCLMFLAYRTSGRSWEPRVTLAQLGQRAQPGRLAQQVQLGQLVRLVRLAPRVTREPQAPPGQLAPLAHKEFKELLALLARRSLGKAHGHRALLMLPTILFTKTVQVI